MKRILYILVCAICMTTTTMVASWPQWRGAQRNGVAAQEPSLSTEFSEEGPKLLWESLEIPSDDDGGHGSVVVHGGFAYLGLVWHRDVPAEERTIDNRVLRKLGHRRTKLSPVKIAAMEKARLGLSPRLRGKTLETWMDQWIDQHLDEEEKLHYSGYVKSRFKQGKLAIPIEILDTVSTKENEKFPNHASLMQWVGGQDWPKEIMEKVVDAIPHTRRIATETVICLNASNGKEAWRFEEACEIMGRSAASTPCVVGERIYAACGKNIYSLNARTGKLIWKTALESTGPASSPLHVEGRIILLDNNLKAIDTANGALLWEQKEVRGKNASPSTWGSGKNLTILCHSGSEFMGVNGNNGEIRWKTSGGGDSTAAVNGDLVAVLNKKSNPGLAVYRIRPDGIEKVWEHLYTSRRYAASPIIYKNRVFLLGSERHLCADISTGKILWNKPASSAISSPILADGKLIVLQNNGAILKILDATSSDYQELASAKIRAMRCPSPAIDNGLLYIRRDDRISCFDIRKK